MSGEYGSEFPSFLSEPTSPEPVEPDHYMGRVAWVTFAGVMLVFAGFVNIVYGVGAISGDEFFGDQARFIFGDLETWGWVHVGLGSAAIIAAFLILLSSELGRDLGILIAGLNVITQVLSISAHPYFALSVIALDCLVIYGLVVHGGRRLDL